MLLMLFSRICLICLGTLLPLVLSFSLCADPLAPKQALWGIAGGILLVFPAFPRFWKREPALLLLLALIAVISLATGSPAGSIAPWIIGAAIFVRAGESGPSFSAKYARIAATTAAIIALYSLSQLSWNKIFTEVRLINPFGDRAPGTMGNPTFLSDYLAALLPVSLTLMSLSKSNISLSGWAIGSVISIAAILLGGSKGGQLSALVGITGWAVIFLRQMDSRRKRLIAPSAALVLALIIAVATPSAIFQSLSRWTSSAERFSFTQRIDILKGASKLVLQSPLIGHGPGTFPVLFPREAPPSLSRSLGLTLSVNHAHNDYAETASDLGLIGLVILLFILFRHVPYSLKPGMEAGFALSMVSMGVTMATNFPLFLPSSAFFIWMHSGLLSRQDIPDSGQVSIPFRSFLSIIGLVIGFKSVEGMLANSYMRPGQEALEKGKPADSQSFLEKAASIYPSDRHIHQLLGRSMEIQGKLPEAVISYDLAWQLAPYHPITAFNVARVQRQIYLESKGRDRTALSKAISGLLTTIRYYPYFPEGREWGGELALTSGEIGTARRFLFDIPSDMVPLTPSLHRLRARILNLEGKYREGLKEASSASFLQNRIQLSRAESLMKEGKYLEAEDLARKVVKAEPGFGAGWELLGYILHTRGSINEARKCYLKLEKLEPGSLSAQLNLLLISLSTRNRITARYHLVKAQNIAPQSEDVILAGARVLAFEGNKVESIREYRRLIGLSPANAQALAELKALESK